MDPELITGAAEDFTGSSLHTIDNKGRIFVATDYRQRLGENFTISITGDLRTVAFYPKEIWLELNGKLKKVPKTDRIAYRYVRRIYSDTFINLNLDGQGRVLIPQPLRVEFGLGEGSEAKFVGMGDILELWNTARYADAVLMTDEDVDSTLDYVDSKYFGEKQQ